jgi:uncharacterized damage-inducible protein DinB
MLMPAAQAPVQAFEDLERAASGLIPDGLWVKPGDAALPTSVSGLLCHITEHTQRHTGQVITTAKIVRGLALG